MLVLVDALGDLVPFGLAALSDLTILGGGISLDFLDELGDELINCILILVIDEDVDNATGSGFKTSETVLFESKIIVINPSLETLTLLIELFLQLDTELLELVGNVLEGISLQGSHVVVDFLNLSEELRPCAFKSLLKSHFDIEKITLKRLNELQKFALVGVIAERQAIFFKFGTLLVDLTEDVLFSLLVGLDFLDRFDLSITLCLTHFVLAEVNLSLLLLLLHLNGLLEALKAVVDIGVGILDNIAEPFEFTDLIILVERLHTVVEQILGMMNVSFLESLVGLLALSSILLLLIFESSAFKLCLKVVIGLLALICLNKLVIEVFEVLQIGDNAPFIFLLASLLESVIVDLKHLKVVAQSVEVLDRVFEIGDLVGANGEDVEILEVIKTSELSNAVREEG